MASVLEQPQSDPNRLILYGVSWETFECVLEALSERNLRITFDCGDLEIMTISYLHEWLRDALGRLVGIIVEELGLPFNCAGSMTFKRKSKQKSLGPDECYWIQNEALVRGRSGYDPDKDAAPDLVLEVDVSSSSIDRIAIYEAMRVGEVWRWDEKKQEIEVRVLDRNGRLKLRKTSSVFPGLKIADLIPFLEIADSEGKGAMISAFRQWARQQIDTGKIRRPDLPNIDNNGKK